jgi:hypothetical protein
VPLITLTWSAEAGTKIRSFVVRLSRFTSLLKTIE